MDQKITPEDQGISGIKQLLRIGVDALKIKPPMYVRSVLGNPVGWVLTRNYSEFTAANIYRPLKTLEYAIDLTVPALPIKAPAPIPPISKRLFWRPTRLLFNPDHNQNPTTFPDETWFFINGICTNESVARMNASYISELFHRPIQMVQNATDSVLVDLFECAVGKGLGRSTEPARKAYPAILAALQDPNKERVVVLCHSQGTIIMSNVLKALVDNEYKQKLFARENQLPDEPLEVAPESLKDKSLLSKLEIYAFANCATNMQKAPGQSYPYIESYANEYDIVARLGCISPDRKGLGIKIDGPTFERKGMWGHLVNAHYLFGIHDYLVDGKPNPYVEQANQQALPRLYGYFNGAKPPIEPATLKLVEESA